MMPVELTGNLFKELRGRACRILSAEGWTQSKLGKALGVSQVMAGNYLHTLPTNYNEPIESNFNQLKSNVDLNNLGARIKVYKKILSNKSEKMKMWVSDKNKTGGFSVYDEKDQEIKRYDASKITYEFSFSERLDNIYKIKNEKIALKIDVERHEKYVIMGAEKIFNNNKVILQIEIFDQQKQEVESMLNKMNFYFIKSNEKDNFYSNFSDSFNNI